MYEVFWKPQTIFKNIYRFILLFLTICRIFALFYPFVLKLKHKTELIIIHRICHFTIPFQK